jgi:iron complex outermembrane receptor protein
MYLRIKKYYSNTGRPYRHEKSRELKGSGFRARTELPFEEKAEMQLKRRYLAEIIPLIFGAAGMVALAPLAGAQEYGAQDKAAPDVTVNSGGELPMTKNVISRSALEQQNPQDSFEALRNVAGVTSANSRGTISDNINIRGIPLSFSTSYRLNGGLPIANILSIPMENKERIEALKGANALMYGVASPAGIVNVVTKRATDKEVSTVGVNANSFGGYGTNVDLGRKFGEEKQFGLRVNMAQSHLETGVKGGDGEARMAAVAADWKATSRLGFKLDVEKYSRDVVEQSTLFQLKPVNGVIAVPRVPDPTRLLSGPWAVYRPETENILLRADYLVTDDWKLVAEAGKSNTARDRFISRISNYNVDTGQGTSNITIVQDQRYVNKYAKAEMLGKFATGPFKHYLTVGVMSNERDANVPSTTTVSVAQNIYNPVPLAAPGPAKPLTYQPQISKDTGVYAYDTASLGQWHFLAGLRYTNYDADNTLASGLHSVTKTKVSSPAFGVIYNLDSKTSLYASYMKGLEETGIAPVGTVNQFQILPPASATQSELGIRTTAIKGVNASVAYFDITRGNTVTDTVSNMYVIDGTTKYQGLEATVSAEINPQLTLNSAAQFMHAVQNSVFDKSINGLAPENTPKVSGNLSMAYRPKEWAGVTLTAGANFTGRRAINPQNQGFIPGVTLFNAGIGYVTKVGGHRTALNLNIDNLADKRYWSSAGGGAYGVGMVRSVKMSAKIDF